MNGRGIPPKGAAGPVLERTPLTPEAQHVFLGAALERRIAGLAARAAAGLPLDGSGVEPDSQAEAKRPVCMACGKVCEVYTWATKYGWAVREMKLQGDSAISIDEVYCPACFAQWGWPNEEYE